MAKKDMREAKAKAQQVTEQADELGTYTIMDGDDAGDTVKFRALIPADDQALRNSALDLNMTEAGLDVSAESKTELLATLSPAGQLEVVLEGARTVIVQASVLPKYTALPAYACPPSKKPVEKLSVDDTLNFAKAIKDFSGVEEDEETFRGDSETDAEDTGESVAGTETEHADDSADSEGVRSEPV